MLVEKFWAAWTLGVFVRRRCISAASQCGTRCAPFAKKVSGSQIPTESKQLTWRGDAMAQHADVVGLGGGAGCGSRGARELSRCLHPAYAATSETAGAAITAGAGAATATTMRGGGARERTVTPSTCARIVGGSICEHQHLKSTCEDCGGGGIHEHRQVKVAAEEYL